MLPKHSIALAWLTILSAIGISANAQPVPTSVVPPINMTHFHCYKVLGNPVPRRVTLRDQFQAAPMVFVGRPAMLCAPVQKNQEELRDRITHLVCYSIEGAQPANKLVRIDNQFGVQTLRVLNSQLLCVPSRKTVVGSGGMTTPLTPQPPCLTSPPNAPGVRYGTQNLALGADVPANGQAEITLLFNTYAPVTPPPMIRFDAGGPQSPVLEVCISTPQKAPIALGPAVTWQMEDPADPGKNTPWAKMVFSAIASPLATTVGTANVNGHGVIKVDILATSIAQQMLNNQQYFHTTPSGRAMITLVVGGQTFRLHVTVGQE